MSLTATPAQTRFAGDLLVKRVITPEIHEQAICAFASHSRREMSLLIDRLKALPFAVALPVAPAAADRPAVTVGMYRLADDRIVKIQPSRESGNLYGKVLAQRSDRGGAWGFVYEAGLYHRVVREGERLTLAEAVAFGRFTGTCCVCGIELTDPKSVEAGVGPICAKRL